ncbi:hypothetical protein TrispH2_004168, partial [Trichoplax sp. H2]
HFHYRHMKPIQIVNDNLDFGPYRFNLLASSTIHGLTFIAWKNVKSDRCKQQFNLYFLELRAYETKIFSDLDAVDFKDRDEPYKGYYYPLDYFARYYAF